MYATNVYNKYQGANSQIDELHRNLGSKYSHAYNTSLYCSENSY